MIENYLDEFQCRQLIKDINKQLKITLLRTKRSDKRLFGIENTSKLSNDIYADNLFAEIANL